jgi:hypothetical protein
MSRIARLVPSMLVLVAVAAPLVGQDAKEPPVPVKDEAKLFKPETIKKAGETAQVLAKKGVNLVIETYATIPPDLTDKVKEMSAKDREAAFEEWARKRIKTLGAASFHIVLTNDPKHLQVTMGSEVLKKGFTAKDRQALTAAMLERLNKKQVDEALLDALDTLRRHFDAPAPDASEKLLEAAGSRARSLR